MSEHRDRRIRKTEEQLVKGLTKLMKTKSIKDITVRELADEVDINRSTFYLHYKDIFDMVEQIENKLVSNFLNTLDELNKNRITENTLLDFLNDTYNVIYSNSDICAVMLGPNGDIQFQKKIRDIIYTKIYEIIKNIMNKSGASDDEIAITTGYFITGIVGIIELWLHDLSLGTPEHMAEISVKLIEKGIHGFNINN
ncbi:MAG: TetR-like C-terminal domain-containing protein [Oscillospiraceae bacterium]|nr:TetR-like C-terminal domain-containing protein [Oscillospiraceae bacterium]